MSTVTIDGVRGQLERRVDSNGRIFIGEWRNQDIIVLLRPRSYAGLSNARIDEEAAELAKKFKKDGLLIEVESELGLDLIASGYNPSDGTITKEALARIFMGIRRLKGLKELE
jgi:hypothetical protein